VIKNRPLNTRMHMEGKKKELLKKILGLVCIAVGIVALALPLIPGIFLIFAGLYLFGGENYASELIKKFLRKKEGEK